MFRRIHFKHAEESIQWLCCSEYELYIPLVLLKVAKGSIAIRSLQPALKNSLLVAHKERVGERKKCCMGERGFFPRLFACSSHH